MTTDKAAAIRRELLSMVGEDAAVREELESDGSLFRGYHPRMEAVHRRNGARLEVIVDRHGWPGRSLAGDDGAEAAWLIAQHAISVPAFQRRALEALREAIANGDAPAWHAAMLEDRIRSSEGRPQRYGTQFDWDENGQMSPYPPIEDPEGLDERRRAVGLKDHAEVQKRMRAAARYSKEKPPKDLVQRRQEMEDWARRVGWRTE